MNCESCGRPLVMRASQRTFVELGFNPPQTAGFVKLDSRGSEYGYFEAKVAADFSSKVIVRKFEYREGHSNEEVQLRWSCVFDDLVSFGHWAKDCT